MTKHCLQKRTGFTMVELAVAMAVGALVFLAAGTAINTLMNSESGSYKKALDRSDTAVQQARLMEYLLRDIRSSAGPITETEMPLQIQRYIRQADGSLATVEVTWAMNEDEIVRTQDGREVSFRFKGSEDSTGDVIELKLQPMDDSVLFDPGDGY